MSTRQEHLGLAAVLLTLPSVSVRISSRNKTSWIVLVGISCPSISHSLICITSEAPEDDSELLLVATGSTSATEFASNGVQLFGKHDEWGYKYASVENCSLSLTYPDPSYPNLFTLPTSSSLGTGIVVNGTILLCDGYTSSGSRECYELTPDQGIQARPPLDIPIGGHSVFVPRQPSPSPNAWWLVSNTQGGTKTIKEAYFPPGSSNLAAGAWVEEHPLPEPLNIVCFMTFSVTAYNWTWTVIFLSGVPTTSASTGNKNWIKYIGPTPGGDSAWTELPQSLEKRLGGSCGVLRQFNSIHTDADNSTVIVMAGGLRSSTSEYLRIPFVSLSTACSRAQDSYRSCLVNCMCSFVGPFNSLTWQMGPDVGESRCVSTKFSISQS